MAGKFVQITVNPENTDPEIFNAISDNAYSVFINSIDCCIEDVQIIIQSKNSIVSYDEYVRILEKRFSAFRCGIAVSVNPETLAGLNPDIPGAEIMVRSSLIDFSQDTAEYCRINGIAKTIFVFSENCLQNIISDFRKYISVLRMFTYTDFDFFGKPDPCGFNTVYEFFRLCIDNDIFLGNIFDALNKSMISVKNSPDFDIDIYADASGAHKIEYSYFRQCFTCPYFRHCIKIYLQQSVRFPDSLLECPYFRIFEYMKNQSSVLKLK